MAIPRNLANIAPHVNASSTELVVNDGGADLNFRVEGDTDANTLFVDAGNNRVGVGTASPAEKLHVDGGKVRVKNVNAAGLQLDINSSFASGENTSIEFTTGGATVRSRIQHIQNASQASNQNSSLIFFTTNTANTLAERMRISGGGYFKASNTGTYINATGTYHEFSNDSAASAVMEVKGNSATQTSVNFFSSATRNTTNNTFYAYGYYNYGAGAWKFYVADSGNVTNTNNSYGSISDVKLKQDIVDAGSQWADIKNLRVRKYRWKSDPDGFMQMGLVAQEAELVSPGLIDEHPDYEEVEVPVLDNDGNPVLSENGEPQTKMERNDLGTTTKAIKYSVLYMKAVKALQEAMERIETLEAKVAALEAQ